jgi:putative DNA methylase
MVQPRLAESTKIYDVIETINKKALSEKQGGGRPPFWEMVFWWTRKPLIGARATIVASVLPDMVNTRDFFRMLGGKLNLRGEVEGMLHSLAPRISKYKVDFEGKKLLDPFAGFGSIPLEAMRLGMDVTAVELLPTAYVFLKAVLEYPAKFGKQLVDDVKVWGELVIGRLREDKDIMGLYDYGVAVYIGSWELRCPHCDKWTPIVGNWWLARVKDSNGKYRRLAYFKPVRNTEDVRIEIVDLNKLYRNVSKASVDAGRGVIEVDGKSYVVPNPNIYARGSKAWCLHCGMEIRFVDGEGNHYAEIGGRKDLEWYIKWALKKYNEGDDRFARQRLFVRVKVEDGELVFEPADERDNERLERAKGKIKELIEKGDPDVPIERVADYDSRTLLVINYGFVKWYHLFNPRQLLTLVKLVKLIREVGKKVEEEKLREGWDKERAFEYAEAVATYLSISMVKFANYDCVVTAAHVANPRGLDIAHALSMRGIAMQWNWVDVSPISVNDYISGIFTNSASIRKIFRGQIRALEYLTSPLHNTTQNEKPYLGEVNKETSFKAKLILDDATTLSQLNEKFDLIVTDPPYADDVPYTELSDFYFVWLKRALNDSDGRRLLPRFHSEAFFKQVGAKYREIETQWQEFARREISTSPGRFLEMENRGDYAEEHFKDLFTQAMISIKNHLNDDGLAAIYFAHTSFDAWALLFEAIRKAKFMVTGAFPVATESKDRVTARGKMTMDTSIVVICRPNPEQKAIQVTSLIPLIRRSAESYAKTLATKEIPGRDILIGTMVGAIKEVTKYSNILTPSGELGMREVLEGYVYPTVASVLAEVYAGATNRNPIKDPHALFYLLAKIVFGGKDGTTPFTMEDVITLCRSSRLDISSSKDLLIETGDRNETGEEEVEGGGSQVASSKTVRLAELKSKEPIKIKNFLLSRGISPDSSFKKIRNPIDAYHLILYYASAYADERIKLEYDELRKIYPDEVDEAVNLIKIVARMKNGAEMELSRRFLQAIEGLTAFGQPSGR